MRVSSSLVLALLVGFVLQEENIETVLINPNIASVQTNAEGEKQVSMLMIKLVTSLQD